MKTTFIAALLLILNTSAFAQWTSSIIYNQYSLQTIFFVNDSTAYIAGKNGDYDGVIFKSNDRGISWDSTHFNHGFISVHFPNKDTGYAGTGWVYNQIYKTMNGGNSWMPTSMIDTSVSAYKGLFFMNGNTGVWGAGGGLIRTMDGGNSMNTQSAAGHQSNIESICFLNSDTGFAGGWYDALIAKTTDGGNTWSAMTTLYGINSLAFPSENTGYAAGMYGTIVKSVDAGNTWATEVTGVNNAINSIYCIKDSICFAVGSNGIILKTTDGGITWLQQISGTNQSLNSIHCTDANTCYAVGDSGVVLKTVNGGVTGLEESSQNYSGISLFPNPVSDKLTVTFTSDKWKEILVSDLMGKIIVHQNVKENIINVDVSQQNKGVYFLKAFGNSGMEVRKFVKL